MRGSRGQVRHLMQLHKELLSSRTSIALVLVQVREEGKEVQVKGKRGEYGEGRTR